VVVAQPRASPSVQKLFVPCGQEIRQLGQKAGAVSEFMVSDRPNSKGLETLTICRSQRLLERPGRNRTAVAVGCEE
jgi:hypothetical protein